MTGITVDNVYYDVRVVYDSMRRKFELIEGNNAGMALSAKTIRDVLGTNYTYSMQVEPNPANQTAYDNFYYKITEPVDYHSITLPFGQSTLTFNAQIVSGSDSYHGIKGNNKWGGLTVEFVPIQPQR